MAKTKMNKNAITFKKNVFSATATIIGTNQFPKPPIKIGITIKKIINNACAVTTTLYN